MESDSNVRQVETVDQLLQLVKFTSIRHFEYCGKLKAGPSATEDEPDQQVRSQLMHLVRPDLISIRCKSTVETARAVYVADIAANYQPSEPIELTGDDIVEAFTHQVAMINIWPYIRVAVHDLAARIELRGVTLGLYMPNAPAKLAKPQD